MGIAEQNETNTYEVETVKMIGRIGIALIIMVMMAAGVQPQQTEASSKSQELRNYALQFEGTPYRFSGTTPSGFDCSGYIRYVYGHFGIDMPRTSAAQYGVGEPVSRGNLQPGDLVFFSNTYKAGISHTGIYVGNNRFISAKSAGVRVVSMDNSYWRSHYTGARRVIQEPVVESEPKAETQVRSEPVVEELPTGEYRDVRSDHWAIDEIKALSERGIIQGFPNAFFRPEEGITRAQAAIMVNRELALSGEPAEVPSDVSRNMAAYEDILALLSQEILPLQEDGTFGPDTPVSREEMAIIFHNAYELGSEMDLASTELSLTDVSADQDSYEAIAALYQTGVTQGYPDKTFRPDVTTSRAHFSAFLHRILQENGTK